MAFTRKQSAVLGIIGLIFFATGFLILPDANIRGVPIFVPLGFIFLGLSISQPLFPRIKKIMGL